MAYGRVSRTAFRKGVSEVPTDENAYNGGGVLLGGPKFVGSN